ncbi:MAG TPA: pyridoxamine 5'-phosphate oxidase [Acidimicrobiia bacterium]|nr:pyridoxamine 5'-phosphate oxidase [Acidimicrobiia bacterium]
MATEPLREAVLDPDPIVQFRQWYEHAGRAGTVQPDAMIVASATSDGRPSARAVLLRGIDHGFCFFTNFESRKGRELDANPRAAALFHWPEVQRQVRATGPVERVSRDDSDAYWRNRPRESRISAWASSQSEPIASRDELDARAREVAARFGEGDIPLPPFWGGYRLVPDTIEFWQHHDDRLHDRLEYVREAGGSWAIRRLQP